VSDIVQKVVSDILVEQAAALSANLTIKIN